MASRTPGQLERHASSSRRRQRLLKPRAGSDASPPLVAVSYNADLTQRSGLPMFIGVSQVVDFDVSGRNSEVERKIESARVNQTCPSGKSSPAIDRLDNFNIADYIASLFSPPVVERELVQLERSPSCVSKCHAGGGLFPPPPPRTHGPCPDSKLKGSSTPSHSRSRSLFKMLAKTGVQARPAPVGEIVTECCPSPTFPSLVRLAIQSREEIEGASTKEARSLGSSERVTFVQRVPISSNDQKAAVATLHKASSESLRKIKNDNQHFAVQLSTNSRTSLDANLVDTTSPLAGRSFLAQLRRTKSFRTPRRIELMLSPSQETDMAASQTSVSRPPMAHRPGQFECEYQSQTSRTPISALCSPRPSPRSDNVQRPLAGRECRLPPMSAFTERFKPTSYPAPPTQEGCIIDLKRSKSFRMPGERRGPGETSFNLEGSLRRTPPLPVRSNSEPRRADARHQASGGRVYAPRVSSVSRAVSE